jgi:hypothetical protein
MCLKEWRYLIKPLNPRLAKRGGEALPRGKDVIAGKQKKTRNATQPLVERHLEDIQCHVDSDLQTSSVMRINTEAGTSKDPRSIVLGSHDESLRVDKIAINFTETGESYNRKSIIVDIYFSEQIANILLTDSDRKSMAECKKRLDWDK